MIRKVADQSFAEIPVAICTVGAATVDKPSSPILKDDENSFTLADVEHPDLEMRALKRDSPPAVGPGVPCFVFNHFQEHVLSLQILKEDSTASICNLWVAGLWCRPVTERVAGPWASTPARRRACPGVACAVQGVKTPIALNDRPIAPNDRPVALDDRPIAPHGRAAPGIGPRTRRAAIVAGIGERSIPRFTGCPGTGCWRAA